jgi:predicted O-linked N-acetylglucosamine transferase (SPINDLY family)
MPRAANKLTRALELHRKGWLAEAELLYREILEEHPKYFDALQLLGAMELQRGHYEEACRELSAALKINPQSHAVHANVGYALVELNRPGEALASCDRALALKPDFPDALCSRGNALKDLGRHEEAIACYDKALALRPDYAEAHYNRGATLQTLKRAKEALASLDHALILRPNFPEALSTRGNTLNDLRRREEALAAYDRALALKPDYTDALYNRGFTLFQLCRAMEALTSLDRALALKPAFPEALMVRGNVLLQLHRTDEALASYDKALEIKSDYADGLCSRGAALISMQRYEEGIADYDRALAIAPDHAVAAMNRQFSLDFVPGLGFAEHQEARRQWYLSLPKHLSVQVAPYPNVADPSRRLVVGYVSADFRRHSASICFGAVLRRHDRTQFEVICYSGVTVEDEVTGEFRQLADKWRSVSDLSDEALAELIRADGVDILVDLSGNTSGNRLLVFARKPAPIQVTAWGAGSGTGLPSMDYLFSDPIVVPAAVRPLFAETVYDLPCATTLEAPSAAPPVAELPALSRGVITFGCLNRFNKISQAALELWASILQTVSGSRLLLKDKAFDNPAAPAWVRDTLGRRGIVAERIELRGASSREEHLGEYNNVDISLDPFPLNGGITTWESLWMGVPVVAKLGNSLPSRVSGAILHAVGLTEWVAGDDDEYVALAIRQATGLQTLAQLRREMRARITASPAGNSDLYTRSVEAAYRKMWCDFISRTKTDQAPVENSQS